MDSSQRASKRQRMNVKESDPQEQYRSAISQLPEPLLRTCLLKAALHVPSVGGLLLHINTQHRRLFLSKLRSQRIVVHFDYYASSVWHVLNVQHAHLAGEQQLERAGDALAVVLGAIDSIARAVSDESAYATKCNALHALVKIGKHVVIAGENVLGCDVRKEFAFDSCLEDAMYTILDSMTEEEVDVLRGASGDADRFEDKLRAFMYLADENGIFGSLEDVLQLLAGTDYVEGRNVSEEFSDEETMCGEEEDEI